MNGRRGMRVMMSMPTVEEGQRPGEAWFVIRSPNPGQHPKVLLVLSSNTYFAYNNYGARHQLKGATTTIVRDRPPFFAHCLVGSCHPAIAWTVTSQPPASVRRMGQMGMAICGVG